jgi:hypothetical protein
MTRLSILAAGAALLLPASAFAADADPALAAFQAICGQAKGSYVSMLSNATSQNFTETQVTPETDAGVSITAQAAREGSVDGITLTLLASQGVRHTSKADLAQTVCKLSSNKPDPNAIADTQAALGFAPDSNSQGLAVFYFSTASGKPTHVAPSGLQTALDAGGFSFIKVQQDEGSAIFVYQTYSK